MDTAAIIAAIFGVVTGLGGLFVSWRTSRSTVRKTEVEALTLTVTALQEENERLRERIAALETDRKEARKEIEALRCQVEKLEDQNRLLRRRVADLERENRELRREGQGE